MAGRAADQAAQHIAASLIRRHDSVGNHKGRGTDMVGNQTNGNILRLICLIFCMSELTDLVPGSALTVSTIENSEIVSSLVHQQPGLQTLQTHSRINIFLLQLGIVDCGRRSSNWA